MKKLIKNQEDLNRFLDLESRNYGLKSSKFPILALKEEQLLYRFNYILRKCELYSNTNKTIRKYIYKILLNNYKKKYAITIPVNVFDEGLRLVHIGPRLVNSKASVGKNCVMHINTCIVAGGTNDEVPTIKDNVILGVGAIVSGGAIIGKNTAVGANSYVNKKFPEGNVTIAGSPAKVISNKTRLDWNKNTGR